MSRRHGDLEITKDDRHQEIVWTWQRIMWALFAVTILLALLGLFGDGPISRSAVSDPEGRLAVEYDRFSRRDNQSELMIEFRPDPSGVSRVRLSRDFVESAGIREVTPAPEQEVADADGTTFVMRASAAGRPVRMEIRLQPGRWGLLRARVRLDGGPEVGFTQVVYP